MAELSSAAQSVWDAFNQDEAGDKLAAALRALNSRLGHEVLGVRCVNCSQIELIAAELES